MRRLLIAPLVLMFFSVAVAQPKPDAKPKDYDDKLFGITVKTAGFGNVQAGKTLHVVEAWAETEGATPSVRLSLLRETKLSEHAQTLGTAMLLVGMKETERKDAKLGPLKATSIIYGGTIRGNEVGLRVLLAESKGLIWALQCGFEAANKAAVNKLFDSMARSFKASAPKIDPKKPPAGTLVISERFGFSIDIKGSVGTPAFMDQLEVMEMDIIENGEQVGYVQVLYDAGGDFTEVSMEDMAEGMKSEMAGDGRKVTASFVDKFSGHPAVRLQMEQRDGRQTYNVTCFVVPQGREMYIVTSASARHASEEAQKAIGVALTTVKLKDIGRGLAYPQAKEE